MVGHAPLEGGIMVRVHVPQPVLIHCARAIQLICVIVFFKDNRMLIKKNRKIWSGFARSQFSLP